jgi:hypothetical protein
MAEEIIIISGVEFQHRTIEIDGELVHLLLTPEPLTEEQSNRIRDTWTSRVEAIRNQRYQAWLQSRREA